MENTESIMLYSNGCPKCNVIKNKLNAKNVSYVENNNVEELVSLGIQTLPVLKVGNEFLSFTEANAWVNNYTSEDNNINIDVNLGEDK